MTERAVANRTAEVTFDDDQAQVALKLMATGDMSSLTDQEKMDLYIGLCRATGINPAFRPFGIIDTKQGQKLYAFKSCGDQLRKLNSLTITDSKQEIIGDKDKQVLLVTVWMQDATGRTGYDVGAVSLAGLGGELLANAYMKAHTKAVRRCTLGMAGLGILDESELDGVPGAHVIEQPRAKPTSYAMPSDVPSEEIAVIKNGITQEPTEPKPNAKQKALAALHAKAAELGYDHDALHKLARHIYFITSMTELTAPQITNITKIFDEGGDLELTIDLIYAAHAMGGKVVQERLVGAQISSSQKRAVFSAIATADEAKQGTVTTPTPEPAEEEPEVTSEETDDAEPDVDFGDQETFEATFREVESKNETVPSNWSELWKFLRQNGIKDPGALNKLIGPLNDDSPSAIYKRVGLALTTS